MFNSRSSKSMDSDPGGLGRATGHFISVLYNKRSGGKRSQRRKSRRDWYQRVYEGFRRSIAERRWGDDGALYSTVKRAKANNQSGKPEASAPISEDVLNRRIVLVVQEQERYSIAVVCFREAGWSLGNYRKVYDRFERETGLQPKNYSYNIFIPGNADPIGARIYRVDKNWRAWEIASDVRKFFGDRLVAGQISFREPSFLEMSFEQLAQNQPFRDYVAEQLGITLESKVGQSSSTSL
ncbi:hypothetical protein HYV84_05500 [Candidatus Woesearchaeota archaeon]|nr:hypothetical protein [Candidatus Woesearchaeota archaeon]